jgi:hypothetical protein
VRGHDAASGPERTANARGPGADGGKVRGLERALPLVRAVVVSLGLCLGGGARADDGEPLAVPVPAATGRITGVVVDGVTRAPLGEVVVVARGEAGERSTTADEDGRFALDDLPPGRWRVDVVASGLVSRPAHVRLDAGASAEVTVVGVRTRAWHDDVHVIEVVSSASGASAAPVEHRVGRVDVRYLPGSFGDPVRVVHDLPGVARAPFGLGALIVRGKDPEETAYSVDGLDVPLVFHFGGLTTVVNGALVDDVVFTPGHAGVRYGRNLGGRVELRTRAEVPDRTHGFASLDLFQATAFVDARLGSDTALSVSLRRSYIDAVLSPILSGGDQSVRAPRYWDGQIKLLHRFPGHGSLEGLVLVADDRFQVLAPDDASATDPLSYVAGFQKAMFRWRQGLAGGWRHELSVGVGPERRALVLTGDDALEEQIRVDVREELVRETPVGLSWRLGLDLHTGSLRYRYAVSRFGPEEEGKAGLVAPAMYLEATWRRGALSLVGGVRSEIETFTNAKTGFSATLWGVDPRLTAHVDLGPTTAMRVAVGRHTSFPTLRQLYPATTGTLGDGSRDLGAAWALQSSLGVDQQLPRGLSLAGTFYLDHLFDLVVGREERFRFFQVPPAQGALDGGPYANDGLGRTYGLELMLKLQTAVVTGWVSATLGRSERTDRLGRTALFRYDQPVVLTALASAQLPHRWRLGARVRYATGNPYTPVDNRIYDLDDRVFVPLLGDPGSARTPPFWSLDLRVDKEWVLRRGALAIYLDVQNATNRRNLELLGWTDDYRDLDGVLGLPILPVFGLRGSW